MEMFGITFQLQIFSAPNLTSEALQEILNVFNLRDVKKRGCHSNFIVTINIETKKFQSYLNSTSFLKINIKKIIDH